MLASYLWGWGRGSRKGGTLGTLDTKSALAGTMGFLDWLVGAHESFYLGLSRMLAGVAALPARVITIHNGGETDFGTHMVITFRYRLFAHN